VQLEQEEQYIGRRLDELRRDPEDVTEHEIPGSAVTQPLTVTTRYRSVEQVQIRRVERAHDTDGERQKEVGQAEGHHTTALDEVEGQTGGRALVVLGHDDKTTVLAAIPGGTVADFVAIARSQRVVIPPEEIEATCRESRVG
jgi:hypothetical protein